MMVPNMKMYMKTAQSRSFFVIWSGKLLNVCMAMLNSVNVSRCALVE